MSQEIRALIVEDEAHLRDCIVFEFESEGIAVFEAESGERALEVYSKEKPDLIVSDIRMPNGDGIWMLEKIRELDYKLPVALMTAYSEVNAMEAMNLGADRIFSKPFNSNELTDFAFKMTNPVRLWTLSETDPAPTVELNLSVTEGPFGQNTNQCQFGRQGFYYQIEQELPPSETCVKVNLEFPTGDLKELSCIAQVVWSRSSQVENLMPGCGFRFMEVPEAAKKFILNWTEQKKLICAVPSGQDIDTRD